MVMAVVCCMVNCLSADTFGRFEYKDEGKSITIGKYPEDAVGVVDIPATINGKPVTVIGDGAFQYCTGLTSITIPSCVTEIGYAAFDTCTNLKNIDIPNSVTRIRCLTFFYCTSLTSITIPANVTSIGEGAFISCTSLTSITIPDKVSSIASGVFEGCLGLTSINVDPNNSKYSSLDGVMYNNNQTTLILCPGGRTGSLTIPASVKKLDDYAFDRCSRLDCITFPSSVTKIGIYAFHKCAGLTQVTLPISVTSIDYNAFSACTGLISITIPASVTSIVEGAFSGCTGLKAFNVDASNGKYSSSNGLLFDKEKNTLIQCPAGMSGILTIPSGVTSIGNSACNSCEGLVGVTIPASVTSIGELAFYSCRMSSVAIPLGVTRIGGCAFSDCPGLTSITIPASVTSIGPDVFADCKSLKAITVDSQNENYSSLDGALYNKNQTKLIQCPGGMCGVMIIPASVTSIEDGAFSRCIGLTSVTIPAGVTRIGYEAFSLCAGLKAISVDPFNANYISTDGALYNKDPSTLMLCPEGKTGSFSIPANVTDIYDHAFSGCTGLTTIRVDSHNGHYSSIDGILFDKNHTSLIHCPAAKGCSVTIPDSVTTIAEEAFKGCKGLEAITIPANLTHIGRGAFYNCSGLKLFTVEPNNAEYSSLDGMLFNKKRTTLIKCPEGISGSITVPSSVTTIQESAFNVCPSLTSVTIPASVNNIDVLAFYGCSGLASVNFLGNAPAMGSDVFAYVAKDFTVYYLDGKTGFASPKWNGYKAEVARATQK